MKKRNQAKNPGSPPNIPIPGTKPVVSSSEHNPAQPAPPTIRADGRLRWGELTPLERKVVETVCDRDSHGLRIEALAEKAGLSPTQIRKALRSSYVHEAIREVTMRRLGWAIPAILQAAIDTAMLVGKDGYFDRRMLLEMAGLSDSRNPGAAFRDVIEPKVEDAEQGGPVLSIADEMARVHALKATIVKEATKTTLTFEAADDDAALPKMVTDASFTLVAPEDDDTPDVAFAGG